MDHNEGDLFLYIYGDGRLPENLSRDELEDNLFARIEGQGDVTGGGSGPAGWNLDIEFDSMNSANFIIIHSLAVLREHGVTQNVTLHIGNRKYTFEEADHQFGGMQL